MWTNAFPEPYPELHKSTACGTHRHHCTTEMAPPLTTASRPLGFRVPFLNHRLWTLIACKVPLLEALSYVPLDTIFRVNFKAPINN